MNGDRLEKALDIIGAHREEAGDGRWLETLARDVAPHLTEWQIEQAWTWAEWPERVATLGKDSRADDDGIDVVAKRKDGDPGRSDAWPVLWWTWRTARKRAGSTSWVVGHWQAPRPDGPRRRRCDSHTAAHHVLRPAGLCRFRPTADMHGLSHHQLQ